MKGYTVEFQVVVQAENRQQAIDLAWEEIERSPDGNLEVCCTAVFNEDGERVLGDNLWPHATKEDN